MDAGDEQLHGRSAHLVGCERALASVRPVRGRSPNDSTRRTAEERWTLTRVIEQVPATLEKIVTVVVVMLENRSFDHMLGRSVPQRQAPGDRRPAPGSWLTTTRAGLIRVHPSRRTGRRWSLIHSASVIELQRSPTGTMSVRRQRRRYLAAGGSRMQEPGCVMGYYDGADVPVDDHLAEQFAGVRPLVRLSARRHAAQPPVRLERGGGRKPGTTRPRTRRCGCTTRRSSSGIWTPVTVALVFLRSGTLAAGRRPLPAGPPLPGSVTSARPACRGRPCSTSRATRRS